MGRRLRRALTAALGAVFLFSVCYIIVARLEYRASARRYEEAAARFTSHGVVSYTHLTLPTIYSV